MGSDIEKLCINTIRTLAIDAVEKALSGHPGAPMGAAAMTFALWQNFLRHNPCNPNWLNRDRFILSAGHASMLLYALLHLTGYELSLDDIQNFRQLDSKTPGHPEYGLTPGVEATTGPLGQGFANGVGMAIAESHLAARFNRPGFEIIDHFTYALCSDGDLMEGVTAEAASLAGHLKLGRLIYLYDDNHISIEGSTELAFSEDVKQRFLSYGWQVIGPIDGLSVSVVTEAIQQARNESTKPSLIICRTVIGYGSPNKANRAAAHGEPLGPDETILTKKNLDWDCNEHFKVPDEVREYCFQAVGRGKKLEDSWLETWARYREAYPEEAAELELGENNGLKEGYGSVLDGLFNSLTKPIATREVSGMIINALAPVVSSLMGGAADLAPSTKTLIKGNGDYSAADRSGRNLHFGIREHAMGAIANGLALHGGVIPYTATFLTFYDYMRPPVRLAALMKQRVVFIFTHDSIGLGEDGPTHQPIEHIAGLRAVPNLSVIRPADAVETAMAWKCALERMEGPTALVLTRQAVPELPRNSDSQSNISRGGYILWEHPQNPDQLDIILIATGSEVSVMMEAAQIMERDGVRARVVSLPSWDLFERQSLEYRESILPHAVTARISMEAGCTLGWDRYIGSEGIAIGIDRFGESAPARQLFERYGFTVENVVKTGYRLLNR